MNSDPRSKSTQTKRGNLYAQALLAAQIVAGTAFLINPVFGQNRKSVDPNEALAKRSGRIGQLESVYRDPLPPGEIPLFANATIISPCRIITNVHVAFGKSIETASGKITLFRERSVGHQVNFAFDVDANTGQFRQEMRATVVAFGNYIRTPRGGLGDIAVLDLARCLDQSEYKALDLRMARTESDVPTGMLMSVSAEQGADGRTRILVEKGCRSEAVTPVDGLFFSNCEAAQGMSGSAVYERDADGAWYWTGLTSQRGRTENSDAALVAINARTIERFLEKSFGSAAR
jgi:hypothetical protein